MFNRKLLGERIKKIRGKKSQDVFANEIGISRGALSYYENGEREPDAEIIYKICECGNVSTDYLLGFTDNKTTNTDLKAICEYIGLSEKAVEKLNYEAHNECINDNVFHSRVQEIKGWIIENEYLDDISETLVTLEEITENYYVLHKEAEKMKKTGLSVNLDDIENDFKFTFDDHYKTDVYRYRLIKTVEEMANYYDLREQVKNNGEHNPPKE